MTEPRPTRRAAPQRPSAAPLVLGALALFLAILTFLAWQLRAGHDPALSAKAATAPQKRRVVVRRIERKTVIERVIPAEGDDGGGSGGGTSTASSSGGSAARPRPPPPRPLRRLLRSRGRHERARRHVSRHGRRRPAADRAGRRGPVWRTPRASPTRPAAGSSASRPWPRVSTATASCARLNADTRSTVPASPLLASAIAAGLWAARRSGGLVDPTLLGPLEAAGYVRSRAGSEPAALADALAAAPPRRARPSPSRAGLGPGSGGRRGRPRPPAAGRSPRHRRDGQGPRRRRPRPSAARLPALHGGLRRRPSRRRRRHRRAALRRRGPAPAHGRARARPAARPRRRRDVRSRRAALARRRGRLRPPPARPGHRRAGLDRPDRRDGPGPTTLEAETLSKLALLSGPERARAAARRHGGLLVHDSGDVELVGPLRGRPRLRVRAADLRAGAAAA